MNSYLIECSDLDTLNLKEEEIIQKEGFQEGEKYYFDLEETSLDNPLEALDTYSLLPVPKIIIIKGIDQIKYEEEKNRINHLIKYIKNPVKDKLLIIEAKKLLSTSKIGKELKKICILVTGDINIKEQIKTLLKEYQFKDGDIDYLIERCLSDFTKIKKECQKLMEYKKEEKTITREDIDVLVVRKLGDPRDLTFHFTRSLAEKNKKEALKSYQELLSYQIEPLSILGLLGSQLRIIYQVKLLEKDHYNIEEITNMLGEKSSYRIRKTKELTKLYTEKELLDLMIKLSDIDYQLKTTDANPHHLIELFIINQ